MSDAPRATPLLRLLLLMAAVTLGLAAYLYVSRDDQANSLADDVTTLEDSLNSHNQIIEELVEDQQVMREQLLDAGIQPEVPPPTETIREIITKTGPAGSNGRDGEQGALGPTGPAGRDGINGEDGIDGKDGKDGATPACWFEASQCVGATGPAGADGTDGIDGTNGAPGPAGPAGPAGETGATGPAGPATECEAGHHWTTVQIQGDDYRVCAAD